MAEPAQPHTGTRPDPTAVYALGSSSGESDRLRRQAEELAADSAALLNRVAPRPGQSAIDLGCGPRGILDLLADRLSPGGRVVGLDADPAHTAMAAEFAAGCGLNGVEIMTADASHTGLPSGSFDLVHARTLLVNVPEPAEVVAEMARLAKPGGWVAGLEPDVEQAWCYPPHPAFTRICEIFPVVFGRNEADVTIGRRVPELFRRAGLQVAGVEARVQMYPQATPAGRSGSTWCAARGHMCLPWGSPARRNLMSWTLPPAPPLMTPARSRCPACSFSSGRASRPLRPSRWPGDR